MITWAGFLSLFFIYIIIARASENVKKLVCISGPSCFAMAMAQIGQYEDYQIGIHWDNIWELSPTSAICNLQFYLNRYLRLF